MDFTPKVKNKSTNTKAVVSFLFLLIVHKAKKKKKLLLKKVLFESIKTQQMII